MLVDMTHTGLLFLSAMLLRLLDAVAEDDAEVA